MNSLNLILFGVLAVSLNSVCGAITDEEKAKMQAVAAAIVAECSKEHGVPEDDIIAAEKSGDIEGLDTCVMGCMMKKVKLINSEGLFDVTTAEQLAKTFIPEGEELKKVIDIIDSCKSVNEKEVSDGEKGCDRAKLVFECTIPFRKEFPIFD